MEEVMVVRKTKKKRSEAPAIVLSEEEETTEEPAPSRAPKKKPVSRAENITAGFLIKWALKGFYRGMRNIAGIIAMMAFYYAVVVYYALGLKKPAPPAVTILVFLAIILQFAGMLVDVGDTKVVE